MKVDKITSRMLAAYKFTKLKELTEHLGIAHTAVSGWRRRGKVAKSALLKCSSDTGYSVEYLTSGEGKESARITQNEFRFVFQRIFSNAKMAGILSEGEAFSNEKMIEISDKIYQSITSDEIFSSLFDDSANNK